ncbi:hypothetical protein GBO34_00955 [Roseivirga pacifica]|uniref:hypothetical protein n=1 Tax=Roseivirga pacifica TaxID=1267423 RepID=UPI00209451F1|nr:hypothetical protein [Roseivirga pacifica]MCO6367882.1 hypothetical protein [Roseivirga pacifica]MCO6377254.1 hypothetical protein [Roseivirga pacifica]
MSSNPITIEELTAEQYPIFVKHPKEYCYMKIDELVTFTFRVVLLDNGYGFEHKRKKKVFKCENDFGEALDQLVKMGFLKATEYDYMVAARDYFRKELEARDRFRPIYENYMNGLPANR